MTISKISNALLEVDEILSIFASDLNFWDKMHSIFGNDFPRVAFQIQFCDRESGRGGILGWTRSLFQHVFLAPLRDSVSRPLKIAFSILEIALLQLLLHTCSNLSLSKEFRAQKKRGRNQNAVKEQMFFKRELCKLGQKENNQSSLLI